MINLKIFKICNHLESILNDYICIRKDVFMFQFNHFNFNVLDLEKSLKFYKDALGLDVVREKILLMEVLRSFILGMVLLISY